MLPTPPPTPPACSGDHPKKSLWKRCQILFPVGAVVVLAAVGSCVPQDESNAEVGASTETSMDSENSVSLETMTSASTSMAPPTSVAVPTEVPASTPVETVATVVVAPATQLATEVLMPVVPCGTDLQLAQDMVQAAGVFLSLSEDATGQGRMQINDRNWTVLYSTPNPGTPIENGDAVFFVVKDDEFTGC